MTVNNFIPEVWSSELLVALRKTMVYTNLVNRDYEGEIAGKGDTVHITSISDPVIKDYVKNQDIDWQVLDDADRALVVDQAKYLAFTLDDVDKRQAAGDIMGKAVDGGGYGLADAADRYIAGQYTQAATNLGTQAVLTPANAFDQLAKLRTKLVEKNVPESAQKFVVVPPWYMELLAEDARFANNPQMVGTDSSAITGFVRFAAGFYILESNNVPNPVGDDWAILAGTTAAMTYAEQINELEAMRLQMKIADGIRGLHVYGAKVVRPEALAVVIASQT